MAVVDVYDAVTENRPYHRGMTHDQAVTLIRAGRGTHFDPDVVDAFVSVEPQFHRLARELLDQSGAEGPSTSP
jgi:putative two-component system response regulator